MPIAKLILPMTRYKFGDIVLVVFIQADGDKKLRPALVIVDIGDNDVVLAPITTSKRNSLGDYKIKDWQGAGLLLESWVRLSKVASLRKEGIKKAKPPLRFCLLYQRVVIYTAAER